MIGIPDLSVIASLFIIACLLFHLNREKKRRKVILDSFGSLFLAGQENKNIEEGAKAYLENLEYLLITTDYDILIKLFCKGTRIYYRRGIHTIEPLDKKNIIALMVKDFTAQKDKLTRDRMLYK